jgi:membrane protein DedA with SNARE-associated domain
VKGAHKLVLCALACGWMYRSTVSYAVSRLASSHRLLAFLSIIHTRHDTLRQTHRRRVCAGGGVGA